MKLTDAKARKAVPADKDYKMPDGHGLYLLVAARGTKLWRMKYRFAQKEKLLSFGPYPEVSLSDARDMRDAARKLIRAGVDPALEKKRQALKARVAAANDFETMARQWYELQKGRWTSVHAADVIRSLERDVFPTLGGMPIASIDAPMVLDTLRMIEQRSALETAKRIRQRISAVFVYAISEGRATTDPAAIVMKALKPQPKAKKQPAIVDLKEMRELLATAESSGASPVTLLASRMLALTAVRPAVVRGAEWAEFLHIDWESEDEQPDALWHVPAERMKLEMDRKAEESFDLLVPLSHQAVETLRAIRPLTGRGRLVFPGQRHAHRPLSENAIGYLYNRVGWHGRHVPHGWRAAFSTVMNELTEREWRAGGKTGASPDRAIIDLMLAHVPKDRVESAYNRAAYLPRRREIAQQWADLLLSGMESPANLLTVARRPAPKRDERMAQRAKHLDLARTRALSLLPNRPTDAAAEFMANIRSWDGGAILDRGAQRKLKEQLSEAISTGDTGLLRLLIESVR